MRKKVFGRKLGRGRKARKALFRSLIRALVINGKVETTRSKAKAVKGEIDKIMSWVRRDPLVGKRALMSKLGNDKQVVNKLFSDFSEIAKKRKSGFTKTLALAPRKGDNSPMVRLEWTELPELSRAKKVVKKAKK
jgi:large subunit ribosomal protein L17